MGTIVEFKSYNFDNNFDVYSRKVNTITETASDWAWVATFVSAVDKDLFLDASVELFNSPAYDVKHVVVDGMPRLPNG